MLSLDGYFEGPSGELDWHNVDQEFGEFSVSQLQNADCLIFGRKTYEMMESYWTTAGARKNDPVTTAFMNDLPKVVFSKKLNKTAWTNTRLCDGKVEEVINTLKASDRNPGKDLLLFGSADLATSLIERGLIDEFRIIINPVVLGGGVPFFRSGAGPGMKLTGSRIFKSGNVLLCYEPS